MISYSTRTGQEWSKHNVYVLWVETVVKSTTQIHIVQQRGREDYDTEKHTEQDTNNTPYIHCIWWVGSGLDFVGWGGFGASAAPIASVANCGTVALSC